MTGPLAARRRSRVGVQNAGRPSAQARPLQAAAGQAGLPQVVPGQARPAQVAPGQARLPQAAPVPEAGV